MIFRQKRNHVHPKSIDAFVKPEAHHGVDFLPQRFVFPVQIGLLFGEQVQVVFTRRLIECPGRAGKEGLVVVGLFAPDVIIPVRVVFAATAFPKPAVFVGRVIDDQVQHQFHAPPMNARQQFIEVVHGAKFGHDGFVVRNVVPIISVGRGEDGTEPENIDAQIVQVIQLLNNSHQITHAVSVRVVETARVDLIDNLLFEIGHETTKWGFIDQR